MDAKKSGFSLLRVTRRGVVLFALLVAAWYGWQYFSPQSRAVRHRLSEADEKSTAAMNARLNSLTKLFAKGRTGSDAFAEDALSWGSKFALVKGFLGIGGEDAHARYLKEAFARHVFSEDELAEAMTATVRGYLIDLDGVENEMLVKLRADLADLDHSGQGTPSHLRSEAEFRKEYERLAAQVASTIKLDTGVTVGREVGLLVTSEIATQAAMQATRAAGAEMGVEAGLLGTGAASSVATLGLGVIIAIIIDYILDAVFKAAGYDPAAKIAGQVNSSLDKMEKALTGDTTWGVGTKGSLRQQLEKLHEARSTLRRDTITQFMKGRKN
jgi:hypothetical protein